MAAFFAGTSATQSQNSAARVQYHYSYLPVAAGVNPQFDVQNALNNAGREGGEVVAVVPGTQNHPAFFVIKYRD